jgi:tRNA pseudouridine13 synthase
MMLGSSSLGHIEPTIPRKRSTSPSIVTQDASASENSKRLKLIDNDLRTNEFHSIASELLQKINVLHNQYLYFKIPAINLSSFHEQESFGIEEYIFKENPGFSGILKHRYEIILFLLKWGFILPNLGYEMYRFSDFVVREVDLQGNVVQLSDFSDPLTAAITSAPLAIPVGIPASEISLHEGYLTKDHVNDFILQFASLINEQEKEVGVLKCEHPFLDNIRTGLLRLVDTLETLEGNESNPGATPITILSETVFNSKDLRKKIHELIKRYFTPRHVIAVTQDGRFSVKIGALKGNSSRCRDSKPGEPSRRELKRMENLVWKESKGEYLTFTLWKENVDTMHAIGDLAKRLKVPSQTFSFSGTKDKRAITTQRIAAYKIKPSQLLTVNSPKSRILVGNFQIVSKKLGLGDLKGNDFTIVIRNLNALAIPPAQKISLLDLRSLVDASFTSIRKNGFINYFGMQRFGTSSVSSHTIGAALLKGEFSKAISLILDPRPHDNLAFTEARNTWVSTRDPAKSLPLFPNNAVAERSVLRAMIHRNFKWQEAGSPSAKPNLNQGKQLAAIVNAIPSNLRSMYLHAYQSWLWNKAASERIRVYGTRPVVGDLVFSNTISPTEDIQAEGRGSKSKLRAVTELTQEMIQMGRYAITDVVLPAPGFEVQYPSHSIGQFFKDLLEKGGFSMKNTFQTNSDWYAVMILGIFSQHCLTNFYVAL